MAGPRLIQAPIWGNNSVTLLKYALTGGASALLNLTVLGLAVMIFHFIDKATARENDVETEAAAKNVVQDPPTAKDLTNTDIGEDSTKELNYFNDRIEDVSVPGPVDVDQPVGILNAPAEARTNVPPPPGTGGGTGAAPLDANISGVGSLSGTLGGMGGHYAAGGFGGRSGSTRKKMLAEGGGNSITEAAVARGLRFLALHQAPDGHWGLHDFGRYYRTKPLGHSGGRIIGGKTENDGARDNDTAGTAFGLLPFLAAGITTRKSKDNYAKEDYTTCVRMAINWLDNKQIKSGPQRGFYGGDQYSHALATIAMCEAYGLTSDTKVKASAQMAINYIVAAQHAGGGWRYSPRMAGDTSVTGWMLMALKSGQMSGLAVPKSTLRKVEAYLDSCESSDKGGYGYTPRGGETQAMTAVGALCRQYLGTSPRNPSLLKSIERLRRPANGPATAHIYYLYYATQVMHHMGGDAWDYWNKGPDGKSGVRAVLVARQFGSRQNPARDKQFEGSFKGDGHVGGRLGGTSLCLLSLEVYYRHLPLYRRDAGVMKADK